MKLKYTFLEFVFLNILCSVQLPSSPFFLPFSFGYCIVLFRFTVSDYPLVSSHFSYWVRFAQTLAFYVMSCGQMFSVLLFSFWPFYCLPSFNLRLLIAPLVSLIQRKRKSDDINKKTFLTYRSFSSFKETLMFSNVLTRSFNWSHSIPNLKS